MTFLCLTFGWGNAYADPTPWEGDVASKFASGTGTKSNPYIISTAEELAYFGTKYNDSYCYYKITADIDLGGREWSYNKGKTFYGHLVGDKGHHKWQLWIAWLGKRRRDKEYWSIYGYNNLRQQHAPISEVWCIHRKCRVRIIGRRLFCR